MRRRSGPIRALRWSVALLSVGGPDPAVAQAPAAVAMTAARAPRRHADDPREAATTASWQLQPCMGGVSYGAPLRWAAAYGGGLVREGDAQDLCLLGVGQLGMGGAGLHAGLANTLGRFGSGTAVTAGVLRTFNRPLDALANRTYVGVAVHVWAIMAVGGQLGYYRRLGADVPGSTTGRGLVTWSTGFGF